MQVSCLYLVAGLAMADGVAACLEMNLCLTQYPLSWMPANKFLAVLSILPRCLLSFATHTVRSDEKQQYKFLVYTLASSAPLSFNAMEVNIVQVSAANS